MRAYASQTCHMSVLKCILKTLILLHTGTRNKIGFQYDLVHDTAQDIAAEMVENLSLNIDEAEYIAKLIDLEVKKLNQKDEPEPLVAQEHQHQGNGNGATQHAGRQEPHVDNSPEAGEEEEEEDEEEEDPSCFF